MGNVFGFTDTVSDMNIYTNSTQAYQQNQTVYIQDSVIDFTSKLNIAIKSHKQLKALSDACGWCDVILPGFDDYLKTHLPTKNYGTSLVNQRLIDPRITTLDNPTINLLDKFIFDTLTDIEKQVTYLVDKQWNLDSLGRYMDGNLKNSPYDLMDDMQKILRLLFKEPPEYEWYVNNMRDSAPGLITGRFETGSWATGDTYELDLAGEVSSAFGQDSDDGWSSGNSDDCEDGFCITVDVITNDTYLLDGNGRRFVDSNFEEIFGSVNDWLIKKGDKRNLACKWPPPVNFFQSNNDQNLSLKNIFRGLGIFVFQKTPTYAKPDGGSAEEKTDKEKEEAVDDIIRKNLKRRNIDTENLMQYTDRQMVKQATPIPRNARGSASNQSRAEQNLKEHSQQDLVEEDMKEAANIDKWTKNLFRFFESSMSSFSGMVKDVFDIITGWKKKPTCKN